MTDLRGKFKSLSTKLEDLKRTISNEDLVSPKSGNRNDYLEISEGKNRFRIFPKKLDTEQSFRQVKSVHWMDLPDRNDDKTFKRSNILNSKIHGGTKLDIIESYLEFSKNLLKEKASNGEDEDADEKMEKLIDWKDGLQSKVSFVMYAFKINADKSKTFGIIEINKTLKDALDKAATAEEDDEAIVNDPFTDIDSGKCIIIDYSPKLTGAKKYSLTLANSSMRLTDEDLEIFDKKPSLSEVYQNVYKLSDFERALKGLQNYDAENGIGTFDEDEWFKVVEKVRSQYSKEVAKKEVSVKTKELKKVVEEDDEELEENNFSANISQFDKMTRDELKSYIADNELAISIKKSMSDADIVKAILDFENSGDSEEDEVKTESVEKRTNSILDDLKKKLGK